MYTTLPSYSIVSVFSLLTFVTAVPYSNSIVAIPAQSTTVSSESESTASSVVSHSVFDLFANTTPIVIASTTTTANLDASAPSSLATFDDSWEVTGTADSPLNATPEPLPAPYSNFSTVEGIVSPSILAPNLHWTALGDSWASGVTYKHDPDLDWTAPRDPNCRRILDAYSVQLFNDTTWSGVRKQVFTFPACSGSRFDSIEGQANFIGSKPEFATLTIGGNDAHFFQVVEACIFQYRGGSYGPEYPDPKGLCAQAIAEAQGIISDDSFGNQLQGLAISELYNAGVKNFADFKVFLTGCAHFFNVDPDSTRCNDQSFGPIPGYRPKLSMELRKAIDDLVEQVNNVYSAVVASMKNPNIQFVDISPGFNGHRFCEPKNDDYDNEDDKQEGNTWIWNFHYFWPDGVDNGTAPAGDPIFVNTTSDSTGRGEIARIFHPTRLGHGAIKNIVKDAVRKAYGLST